jgi:hypothetical protein
MMAAYRRYVNEVDNIAAATGRVAADWERILGPDHPDPLMARGDNLAGSYSHAAAPPRIVAWAGDLTDPELPQALATWFGAATPA